MTGGAVDHVGAAGVLPDKDALKLAATFGLFPVGSEIVCSVGVKGDFEAAVAAFEMFGFEIQERFPFDGRPKYAGRVLGIFGAVSRRLRSGARMPKFPKSFRELLGVDGSVEVWCSAEGATLALDRLAEDAGFQRGPGVGRQVGYFWWRGA